MLLKQTKIVASISDRRCDVDFIKQLFEAGMNVVRMNTAHASREGFEALIANVRSVSNRIAILMDTKGPEVRTTANAEPIPYQIGDKVKIVGNPDQETTRECIAVSYPDFVNDLNIGGLVLIDDGTGSDRQDRRLSALRSEKRCNAGKPQERERTGCSYQSSFIDRKRPQ